MHRLSGWRSRSCPSPQVQKRNAGRLSARSEAREATCPHDGLGALFAGNRQREQEQRHAVSRGHSVMTVKKAPPRSDFVKGLIRDGYLAEDFDLRIERPDEAKMADEALSIRLLAGFDVNT